MIYNIDKDMQYPWESATKADILSQSLTNTYFVKIKLEI